MILKEKKFSPFEIASRYNEPQAKGDSSISVVDTHNQNVNNDFTANIETTDNFLSGFQKLQFVQVLDSSKDYDFINPQQMFPFRKTDYKIYLPDNSDETDLSLQILCKNYTPTAGFILPDTAIPGSIRVLKNKIRIFNFSYNESNHTLTINEPVFSNDIIEIQWKEGLTYSDSGTTRFAAGAHWKPVKGLDIFLQVPAIGKIRIKLILLIYINFQAV